MFCKSNTVLLFIIFINLHFDDNIIMILKYIVLSQTFYGSMYIQGFSSMDRLTAIIMLQYNIEDVLTNQLKIQGYH